VTHVRTQQATMMSLSEKAHQTSDLTQSVNCPRFTQRGQPDQ
jgi:hypothetical protein